MTLCPCLRPAAQEVSAAGDASPNAWNGVFSLRDKTHVYSGLRQSSRHSGEKKYLVRNRGHPDFFSRTWLEHFQRNCDLSFLMDHIVARSSTWTSPPTLLPSPCKHLSIPSVGTEGRRHIKRCQTLLAASATWQHTLSSLHASSQ